MSSETGYNEIVVSKKSIDIEAVIAQKNSTLLRHIPKFLIRWFEHFLHLNEINEIIYNNRNKPPRKSVEGILSDFQAIIKSHNIDKIPKEGRILIASNHPLGGMDGLALMQEVSKIRKDILFPVNDLLLHIPVLEPLFIPVNKHGSNADNIKLFNEAFASDKAILYFPAGLCSRQNSAGEIMDLEWKKTFIAKSIASKRNIIPTFTDGKNSNRFYRLARWRSRFKMKTNIEMLFLPDEMFKQKGRTTDIYFGDPIPYTFFDSSKRPAEWAALLQAYIYTLKDGAVPFSQFIKSQ